MLPVLIFVSFACLAAADPHYDYSPPQGGAVALHGFSPLAPFVAIRNDAQKPVYPVEPLHTWVVPISQPLPPYFAVRDVQVPIKPVKDTKPQPLIPSPFFHPGFGSAFVPHPPFFAIRDVQVPRVPASEEEMEDESGEVEDTPQALPVLQGTLPPFIAAQHDAQTPINAVNGFVHNIFGLHTDAAYGPAIAGFGMRTPSVTVTNDIPVPPKAPVPPFFGAVHSQQIPVRGTVVEVSSDGDELEDVELVGADDTTTTTQESGMQGPHYVQVAHFPLQIANIFDTREANPDNEIHAPGGIVQSTQPIFVYVPFINSKAHQSLRPFINAHAHPDTHKGPNEDSAATLFH